MKKQILVFLMFICSTSILFAQPADSLMQQREALNEKYSQLNIPGKELSNKDYKSIVDILKKIVIVDTRIIESFAASKTKIKNLEIENASLNTENDDLSKKINEYVRLSMVIYISGGVLVTIIVILLILIILSNRKYSRLQKDAYQKTQ